MIDWLNARISCSHKSPITGGALISVDADGSHEWQSNKWFNVKGSHDSNIRIRTYDDGVISVSGNPVKYLQGHNIFGTDDLTGLVAEFMARLVIDLDGLLTPTPEDVQSWWSGEFDITMIDINYSYQLKSRSDVISWIYGAAEHSHLKHRGAGLLKGDTLYFGKHSRRWALKFYAKGQEISAKGHTLPLALSETKLPDWADTLLRSELRLLSLELKHLGLNKGYNWSEMTPSELHSQKQSGLSMPDNFSLDSIEVQNLPSGLRTTYIAWKAGEDLRALLPRNTFYRHRKQLIEHGIDISVKLDRDSSQSNVVPLVRVLEAVPVGVPEWATGTDLYFEPRTRLKSV